MENPFENVSTREQQVFVESGKAQAFMRTVFTLMTLGLTLTGSAAWYFGNNIEKFPFLFQSPWVYIIMFAPLAFVLVLSFGINRLSYVTANVIFATYSLVMGVSLSWIFMVYTNASIASTFFITAGTFGVMAILGMTTKIDLSRFGSILFMALIGLIIAGVVNWFLKSETLGYIYSFAGVLIFSGLTAYDTQRLMQMGAYADMNHEGVQKAALMGALSLYLDFVNLFMFLLRFLGRRD